MDHSTQNLALAGDRATIAVAAARGLDSLHRAIQARRLYGDDHAAYRAFRDDAVAALTHFGGAADRGPIVVAEDRFILDGAWIDSEHGLRELAALLREFDLAAIEVLEAPDADALDALTELLAAVGAHRLTGLELASEVAAMTGGGIAVLPLTLAPTLGPGTRSGPREAGDAIPLVRAETPRRDGEGYDTLDPDHAGPDVLLEAAAAACRHVDDDERGDAAQQFIDRMAAHDGFRRALLAALGRDGAPKLVRTLAPVALPIVLEHLGDATDPCRQRLFGRLVDQVDAISICRAVIALAHRKPSALIEFGHYFDRLPAEAALRLLAPMLTDSEVRLRRTAVELLVRPGIVIPVPALDRALTDEDEFVRTSALRLTLLQPSNARLNVVFRLLTGTLAGAPPTRSQVAAITRALLVTHTEDELRCLAEALILTSSDRAAIRAGVPAMIASALSKHADAPTCRMALRRWRYAPARLHALLLRYRAQTRR